MKYLLKALGHAMWLIPLGIMIVAIAMSFESIWMFFMFLAIVPLGLGYLALMNWLIER